MESAEWQRLRSVFHCPHGYTNVWQRGALRGNERIKLNGREGPAAHLNQKPLDLLELIIKASSNPGDVVWEPFGGLFSASIAAARNQREAYAAELDPSYFTAGVERAQSGLA
jgi:site-specific DNA-methyltransferase (adenine-specific)